MPSHSARAFSISSGASSPRRRLDAFAEGDERRAPLGGALQLGQPLGFLPPPRLDRGPRARELRRELVMPRRERVLWPRACRPTPSASTAPLLGGLVELRLGVGGSRRAGDRVEPRHHQAHALLPLLVRGLSGRRRPRPSPAAGRARAWRPICSSLVRRRRRGARAARRRRPPIRRRVRGR